MPLLGSCSALNLMTQGKSEAAARRMLKDAVELLVSRPGFSAAVKCSASTGQWLLESRDDDALLALLIRRQRQKHGLSLQEAARRAGSGSANAFARYEQGRSRPTVKKVMELIRAINPKLDLMLKVSEIR